MATCLDVTGVAYPDSLDGNMIRPMRGKSLLPVFQGSELPVHNEDILFWEHTGKRAARKGKWKIVSLSGKDWELYDMEKDRTELNDLSQDFPEKLQELANAYDQWAEENGVLSYEEWYEARHNKRE